MTKIEVIQSPVRCVTTVWQGVVARAQPGGRKAGIGLVERIRRGEVILRSGGLLRFGQLHMHGMGDISV